MAIQKTHGRGGQTKFLLITAVVVLAFFASYAYAQSRTGPATGGTGYTALGGLGSAGAAAGGCGGGCCGGGGPAVEGTATVEGGVQRIAVDTSQGTFEPNTIRVKAGVPIEIDFSQAPGGCLSGVLFPDFGISEDLTAGGKTVKLPALEKGEYTFFCQMQMVSARIVAE